MGALSFEWEIIVLWLQTIGLGSTGSIDSLDERKMQILAIPTSLQFRLKPMLANLVATR